MRGLSSTAEHAANLPQDGGASPTSPLQFDSQWRLNSRVVPASRPEVEQMIRTHYLHRWPGVVVLILAARYVPTDWTFGVIVYALPPTQTNKRYGCTVWELARLWLHDEVPKNAESWLISQSVRHISKTRPEVGALVSYADPSVGHQGTVYRAANWTADGRTDDERKSPRCDYLEVSTMKRYSRKGHVPPGAQIVRVPRVSKHRYIYRLKAAS